MAINLMNENEIVKCPKCRNVVFKEEKSYTLKKNPKTYRIEKDLILIDIYCSRCNEKIDSYRKQYNGE